MAASAIWRICWRGPRGIGGVGAVAARAIICIMAGWEAATRMGITDPRPAIGAVAVIALRIGYKVAIWLACRNGAVMAIRAAARNLTMIKAHIAPIGSDVARVASIA